MLTQLQPEAIVDIVVEHLQEWPLFVDGAVTVTKDKVDKVHDNIYISFVRHGVTMWSAEKENYFNLQVTPKGICYILSVGIKPYNRGRGWGAQLYQILERIARYLGCCEIRQTPSGTTGTGETRKDYLLRHGWLNAGVEVFKRFENKRVMDVLPSMPQSVFLEREIQIRRLLTILNIGFDEHYMVGFLLRWSWRDIESLIHLAAAGRSVTFNDVTRTVLIR